MGFVRMQAEIVQMHIELGDDVAMRYAMTRMIMHAKSAAVTANDIAALREEMADG
jgi:hypothetical protein